MWEVQYRHGTGMVPASDYNGDMNGDMNGNTNGDRQIHMFLRNVGEQTRPNESVDHCLDMSCILLTLVVTPRISSVRQPF